jgi:alkyl sulfatase BDS1-like metallo-beta-lactamase superfamily hydrolase
MRVLYLLLVILSLPACGDKTPVASKSVNTPADLKTLNASFTQGVEKVTDGVYVAIGFGLANSIMIEGDEGLIIVDTMESVQQGEAVLAAFREISDKPVVAIIYTHNHTDHVFGSVAFGQPGEVAVYAHDTTQYYIDRVINVVRPIINLRSMRMFGNYLPEDEMVNDGIGAFLGIDSDSRLFAMPPTHTFSDQLKLQIAGVDIELVHAPGETNDQIFVWLPQQRVLLPGDNIYKAFPNLYTIRGTPYRDVTQWVDSLDKMRQRQPQFLVPSHTRPIVGVEEVDATLQVYRDAIQFVHDQTVRYMNKGLTPDQIVERVRLPEHLASHPYLQEFYGKVDWSVRSIFDGYMGWFDGNSSTLQPLGEHQQATRMAQLAGGKDQLLSQARAALADKDYQWVLSLTDHLLVLQEQEATPLRAQALRALGEQQSNPNARHYYFTQARELADQLTINDSPRVDPGFLASLPIANFMYAMPPLLKAEETLNVDAVMGFHFSDSDRHFRVHIRRGVAEVSEGQSPPANSVIVTDEQTWKEIAAGLRSPATAALSGDLSIEGGKIALLRFLGYFEKSVRN